MFFIVIHANAIYGVILVPGIVGNVAVLVAAATQTTAQRVVNIYLGHLAVADILHLMSIPPLIHMAIVNSWVWGDLACKAYYTLHYLNWTASTFIITAMGFDRFIAVVLPGQSGRLRSCRFVWGLLLSLWALSGLLVCPIGIHAATTAWTTNGTNETTHNCGHIAQTLAPDADKSDNRSDADAGAEPEDQDQIYIQDPWEFAASNFVIGCAGPLVLLTIFYGFIIRKVLAQARTTTAGGSQAHRRFSRVSRMVTAVVTFYVVCSLPHWIYVNLGVRSIVPTELLAVVSHATTMLGYLNSAGNPVLYACFNKPFCDGLRKALPTAAICCRPCRLRVRRWRRRGEASAPPPGGGGLHQMVSLTRASAVAGDT